MLAILQSTQPRDTSSLYNLHHDVTDFLHYRDHPCLWFRVEKCTAQLSAHPQPCLQAQINADYTIYGCCYGGKNGELIMWCARKSFGWFIYARACMNFFSISVLSFSLPAMRLFCLYIQWFAYKYVVCEEGLLKYCVFILKFLVYRRDITGLETFLMFILSKNRLILHENITPACH